MNKLTVESLFGFNAGIVWEALNQNGASNPANLVKTTSLSREVYGALGWLGREDKIMVEQKGRAIVFSLREKEAGLSVPEQTVAEKSMPKTKSKPRRIKSPKAKTTRKVKAPVKQAPAKQTEMIEEFLLH